MQVLVDIILAFWELFKEMAPYLLLGFLLAGILHVYFPQDKVTKFLGKNNLRSVINAALIGVPLPLCSCGVIPTGVSFHKNGASKGASVSFLISTPQTGVDSILVTYSLMGLPFAIIRPIAALITGIVGGAFTNKIDPEPEHIAPPQKTVNQTPKNKFITMLRYAFIDFLQDIAKWLLVGLGIAALITVLIPDSLFENYLSNPYLNMGLILLASVPMYVCATGSIPIATALMLKGISPGAAFVFLMAGPATNAGTITVIGQSLGKKALVAYVASITIGALIFGILINEFLPAEWFTGMILKHVHSHVLPEWLTISSSWILLALLINGTIIKYIPKKQTETLNFDGMKKTFTVDGMTCNHCKASVEKNLSALEGINHVEVDLVHKKVFVDGDNVDANTIQKTVDDLGYKYLGQEA